MFNFKWWRDVDNRDDNRDGAKAIADILKVAVPALIVVGVAIAGWLGLNDAKDPDGSGTVECNSTFTQTGDGNLTQTCGDGDVQIDGQAGRDTITCNSKFRQDGDGNLIQNCGDGTVIVGLTQEKFFAELERREGEIRADMERASTAEKKVLQQELEIIRLKMANVDETYAQTVEELRQLRLRLTEFEDAVPRTQLEAAQQALFEGNRKLADELLAKVQENSADAVVLAADAAKHYADAARLNPTFETLLNAREFAWRAGEYRKAVRYGEDLLEVAREAGTDRQLAVALNAHALSLHEFGLYDQAESLYREALEIDRKTIGVEHPDYATHLNNFAALLWATGRYDEAEPLYREALEIGRKTIGVEHPNYATRLNNPAALLRAMGRYDEAEPLYREALEIDRKTIGVEHPDYATHLNNLAALLRAAGRSEEAEPLYRETLEMGRKTIGVEHPNYAIRLNNLAELLRATGRYEEAEPLYREALEIDRKTIGVEHPDYAIGLNNLAELLRATGRYEEAEPLYREALEIDRKTIGVEHPNYATHLNNLAGLLEATGRYDEAEPLLREALGVFERALGAEHPTTKTVRNNLETFLASKPD